eukprot:COSAG06_NODE_13560_length_1244_cov_2.218341_2_plen_44_part_01
MGPRWARWDQHWTGWSAIGPGPNPTTGWLEVAGHSSFGLHVLAT